MPQLKVNKQKLGRILDAARRRLGKLTLEGAISEAVAEIYGEGEMRKRYYAVVLNMLQREKEEQKETQLRRDIASAIRVAWERGDDLLDDELDRPGIPDKPGRYTEGFGQGRMK